MKKVALLGKSLVMSTIGASLEGCSDLQILPFDPSTPDAQQHLITLQPDVVIIDLAANQTNFAIALWKVQPELLLVGVDLVTDKSLVLSSQPARVLTTDDLLKVIQGNDPGLLVSNGKRPDAGQSLHPDLSRPSDEEARKE